MTWPVDANEQRWSGGYSYDPVGPSGSHQQPIDPVFVAPAPYFQAPLPPHFAQAHAADGYPHLQNHFTGGHSNSSGHRNSFPANSFNLPRSNASFSEGSRAFVPRTSDFGDDGRYRRRQPPRRPAHWEDDPYPASSSLRDSIIQACSPTCWHSQTHNSAINRRMCDCSLHGPLPSCSCGVPHSTLTHVGPSTCRCYYHAPCDHRGPASVEPTVPLQPKDESRGEKKNSENQRSVVQQREEGRGKGGVGRWLASLLSTAKRVNPRLPKKSKNGTQLSEVEPKAVTAESGRPRVETNGLRRVSDPSSVATAGASSGLREVSPTTDTFVSTSIPTHDHGADSQLPPPQVVQTIPRPSSSASTCQCYPPSVILHAALQHNPFDGCIFQWDISFHPTTHLYQSHKPEEILANKRPVVYPDFLDRHATDPPMRHMFINALGDFPLARCQGDPNPSRSKNKERHMYSSGQGDERVEMRTLPWPIRVVGSSEGSRYITLKDVFRAIHDNFQRYITVEEYGMYTIERKRIIASAYHVREKRLEEVRAWPPLPNTAGRVHSEYSEDLIEEGYMRCDYLGTQLVFRGLEVSPDKEGYTLFLGPSL